MFKSNTWYSVSKITFELAEKICQLKIFLIFRGKRPNKAHLCCPVLPESIRIWVTVWVRAVLLIFAWYFLGPKVRKKC